MWPRAGQEWTAGTDGEAPQRRSTEGKQMSDHDPQWQPSHPPVPSAYQPAPPPKKNWFQRHKVMTVLLGLILIAGLSTALSGGGGGDTDTAATAGAAEAPGVADAAKDTGAKQKAAKAKPPGARTGMAVRDGKFEFVVTKVTNGPKRIGDEYLNETPQGRFLLITVKVTNIGDEARQLSDSNQKLFDTKGRSYEAHSTAAMLLPSNKVLFENINPGNAVTGTLVFDIPREAQPGKLELHDSLLSGGVTVNLS